MLAGFAMKIIYVTERALSSFMEQINIKDKNGYMATYFW